MAIQSLYVPYQGTKAALMTLPSTGHKGVLAFTIDTQEFYYDSGSGVGIGSAWIFFGGGGGGFVNSVNGLSGAVIINAGPGISVAVVGGDLVITNTATAPTLVPNVTPVDSGDHVHFTLPSAPNPSAGLILFKNGNFIFEGVGNDYLLVVAAITLAVALDVTGPNPDTLVAFYWV